jgi:hypothetical protein
MFSLLAFLTLNDFDVMLIDCNKKADTVIFYDSDWNPAMDAQAQDRAHRIGQTREVHIYRLITEHTIEENIFIKAQQKRKLDILVMDGGNFDASQHLATTNIDESLTSISDAKDIYSKHGLRTIFGVEENMDDDDVHPTEQTTDHRAAMMSTEQLENAMTSLEDADDVLALRGAQKEMAEELKEFDETIEYPKDEAEKAPEGTKTKKPVTVTSGTSITAKTTHSTVSEKSDDDAMDKEFAAWQTKVGISASAIAQSLTPAEQYGLRFREEIDPFYSQFAIDEYNLKMEARAEQENAVDVREIQRIAQLEEEHAIEHGDLLVTEVSPTGLIHQRCYYRREKARLRADKLRRRLTGQDWECRVDGRTKLPFWYNVETGEAIWDKPKVLYKLEALLRAEAEGWTSLPEKPLVVICSFLVPSPDRMNCALVCRNWHRPATDIGFVKHVYPVEMGAYTRDISKLERNHYRTIPDAVAAALPGDTIGTDLFQGLNLI